MIDSHKLDEVRHSRETRPHLITFINLEGCDIGIEFQWELRGLRFTIYREHRRNIEAKTRWISFDSDQQTMYDELLNLVTKFLRDHNWELDDNELPKYAQIELWIPISHLHYHINAGTIEELFTKEIIY